MPRALNHQLQYAITQGIAFGESKHAASTADRQGKVYSVNRAQSLRDTAKSVAAYLTENRPEIKMVRDIKAEDLQAWADAKKGNWSGRTLSEHLSELAKLEILCKNAFCMKGWGNLTVEAPETLYSVRTAAMAQQDYNALRDSLAGSQSGARDALELAGRSGLRVNESACLRGDQIDTQRWTVFVSREGAKNGRARTIEIREQDRAYYAALKDRAGNGYVCGGIKPDSINDRIRDRMRQIGIADKYPCSTIHAIRKMYARERMQELRGPMPLPNRKAEMRAFDIVSGELGHGTGRADLYAVYIGK